MEPLLRVIALIANALVARWLTGRVIFSPRVAISDGVRLALGVVLAVADLCVVLWLDGHARSVAYWALVVTLAARSVPAGAFRSVSAALGAARLPVFASAVLTVSCLLYVHLPITTFLTSPGEIGLHLPYLLKFNVRDAMIVVYLSLYVYAVITSEAVKTAMAFAAMLAAAVALVYAYVLPFGYPPMSGVTFEQIPIGWGVVLYRAAVDLLVIVLVTVGAARSLLRYGGARIATIAVLANVALVVSTGISVARDRGVGRDAGTVSAVERPIQLSKTRPNVLIVFLDRFMGGFVEGILEREPDLAPRLVGFEWFPNTISAGENSISGVHPVFGGYDYTPDEMNRRHLPLRDLSVEAYRILPLNFADAGYQVNVVNPRGLGFTMLGDCGYLQIDRVTCSHISPVVASRLAADVGITLESLAESQYADLLVLLGAMRGTPYTVKEVVHRRGPWTAFMDHSAGTTFRQWAELRSLPDLTDTGVVDSSLNIVWNILPHEPYFLDTDCRPSRTLLDPSTPELQRSGHASAFSYQHELAARCSLRLVVDYFDWLRANRVYDNTTIVIVSDHGIVGPVDDRSSRAVRGGTTDNLYVGFRSVLFVKPAGAIGPLRVSEAFLPNAEVPRIVCAQIGGCVNPYLGRKTIAAHGRDDPFVVSSVPWQFNLQEPSAFVVFRELAVRNRNAYAISNWEQTRPGSK